MTIVEVVQCSRRKRGVEGTPLDRSRVDLGSSERAANKLPHFKDGDLCLRVNKGSFPQSLD